MIIIYIKLFRSQLAQKPVSEAHTEKPRISCRGVRDRLLTVNPRPPPRPPVPDSTNFRAMYFWLQKGDRGGYVLCSIGCATSRRSLTRSRSIQPVPLWMQVRCLFLVLFCVDFMVFYARLHLKWIFFLMFDHLGDAWSSVSLYELEELGVGFACNWIFGNFCLCLDVALFLYQVWCR